MGLSQEEIEIRREHWEQMRQEVDRLAPEEACGLVGGLGGRSMRVYAVENELHSPVRFRMEPQQQVKALLDIEARELDLLAIYHSHPAGPADPSPTDVAEASFPEAASLIWSRQEGEWTCRAFRIAGSQIDDVTIKYK